MASSLQSIGPVRLPRSFSRRCRIRCQIWAGESSGASCRSLLTASCVPLGPYFIPTTRTWSICGNQLKDWFAFLPLGSGPSSMSTSHCKSSALSSCDHVPNSWARAFDSADQSRRIFISVSCLPRNAAATTADTHLLVISVKRYPRHERPYGHLQAPVLLTNKTKVLHLIELKDYWVKAGRRKCARGYACPGFAGRRVPFGKSLNGWPGPHVGSPLPTLTRQQGVRHRVQSVLAPRVRCRLALSVAAHPSAATCSYNSLLLSLRSLTSGTSYPFPLAPKTGHL